MQTLLPTYNHLIIYCEEESEGETEANFAAMYLVNGWTNFSCNFM